MKKLTEEGQEAYRAVALTLLKISGRIKETLGIETRDEDWLEMLRRIFG